MKSLLKYGLRQAADAIPLSSLIRLTGRKLLLPVYHLASDHPAPHISPIYPVRDMSLFRQDLDTLLRHYQPLDTGDLMRLATERRMPDKPSFYLSFDDGLRQIWDEVAPVLLEKGVPAAFFVNTHFVDNRALFYRYLAGLLVSRIQEQPPAPATVAACQDVLRQIGVYNQDLGKAFMQVEYALQPALELAALHLGVDPLAFLKEYKPYLTLAQLKTLQQQGFTIGAHSVDHPEYRFVPLAEQLRQTAGSLDELAEMTAPPYRTFAFPFTDFGVTADFFEQIAPQVDLTFGCAGIKDDIRPTHLQRLPMEGTLAPALQVIGAEYLYYLIRHPLGKNVIRRR